MAAAVGLTLTLLCLHASMVAALYLSLWFVVLLMPPLATTADSTLPARRQFHARMHRVIILVIPCIATMHVLVMYMHAVYCHGVASLAGPLFDMSAVSACQDDVMHSTRSMQSGSLPGAERAPMLASFLVLLTLAAYRALWLLHPDSSSTPVRQPEAQTLLQQLQQEETLIALSKRFLIRKRFQFVLVAVVAQALLCPSVLGALLLVGCAASVLAFGVSTGGEPVTASVAAAVVAAAWGAVQYAVCSLWLQGALHVHKGSLGTALRVLGVPALQVCVLCLRMHAVWCWWQQCRRTCPSATIYSRPRTSVEPLSCLRQL